jgi:tight adherence protein B
VLPVLLGIALYMLNPTQMNAFVTDPVGFRLMELAIVLEVIGALAIRKIVAVEY